MPCPQGTNNNSWLKFLQIFRRETVITANELDSGTVIPKTKVYPAFAAPKLCLITLFYMPSLITIFTVFSRRYGVSKNTAVLANKQNTTKGRPPCISLTVMFLKRAQQQFLLNYTV